MTDKEVIELIKEIAKLRTIIVQRDNLIKRLKERINNDR